MQNCNSSARTAAKQSSKSPWLFRQPCILAMLLLCAVYCKAQTQRDTVRVMLLMSDTSTTKATLCCREDTLNDNRGGKTIMVTQYSKDSYSTSVYWKFGYSVREKYNRNMESNGDWSCWNCKDYMMHSYYLDDKKKSISPTTIVWQSVSVK